MTSKRKIIVTGANGQLGKEFQQVCSTFPDFEFIFLAREDMPIQQFELVRNIFKTIQPAFCINCAAYTAVDKAEEEKELAHEVNSEAVGVLAAICLEHETRFIHISTDYVFDGMRGSPYTESDETNPVSAYGTSKLLGEEQALEYNPETIILRTSWVYSQFGKNFVKTMLKLMNEKDEINVVNDQIGSPTYAADLAETIMKIIKTDKWKPGIYHFTNDGIISWFDFALAIKELSGSRTNIIAIPSDQYPTPALRPPYSVLEKSKIQNTFGITLKNWKQSLAVCIDKIKTLF